MAHKQNIRRRIRRPGAGRPRKLTADQLAELEQLLLQGATAHGWINDLWTTKRIAEMIRRHFRIHCSLGCVRTTITEYMRWTQQRPIQQFREADDTEITRWLEAEYPRILERARRRQAHLVFVDESGFMLAPTIRRTYAPRGRTPVYKVSDPHGRISVIGAMTVSAVRRHFGFQFHLLDDNANFRGESVARFVRQIHKRIPGPITLIWDRISIHGAEPVRKYLNRHRTIVLAPFPANASSLNPVDKIWFYVKYDRLPNFAPPDLVELRSRITEEFCRLRGRPDVLESLFKLTKLSLGRGHAVITNI